MEYKIFGCKTNKYFTEKWMNDPHLEWKTGVFISSCIVTAKADAKWKKFALKHLLSHPEEYVYISGCAPLQSGKIREDFFEFHKEFESYKDRIILLEEDPALTKTQTPTLHLDKLKEAKKRLSDTGIYTRKYLVIQTGCDNHCAFCLTVRARGPHKNRNIVDILEEISEFEQKWGKEIVLTGTNIGAWGSENSNHFEDSKLTGLITTILEKTSIHRVRISSLGVEFLSDELLELLKNPRMHAYVHLSIQYGADAILTAMHRHYTRAHLRERLEKLSNLRREDNVRINIWADLIVGFPGETDADFQDTLSIVEDFCISNLHAFPFSAHEWGNRVSAAHFKGQIPENIKQARWAKLMQAWREAKRTFLAFHNEKTLELLPEKPKPGENWRGYSENHIFLDEEVFSPISHPVTRGVPVSWIYHFRENRLDMEESGDDE